LERLEGHPELKERFEMILDIVENASGDVEKADEAERRAIEAVRQLGHEIVQGWAQRQHEKKENECDQKGEFSRKEKNALLVHGLRKNSNRGTDLSARSSRAGRSAFQGIGRGPVPGLFALVAAGDGGFRGRQPVLPEPRIN
jgi:hypothetical protein